MPKAFVNTQDLLAALLVDVQLMPAGKLVILPPVPLTVTRVMELVESTTLLV